MTVGGPRNIVLDGFGSAFDAAFAKLLWPLVNESCFLVVVFHLYDGQV